MLKHIFPDFLQNEQVYAQAEKYWIDLWNQISPFDRAENGWTQPWFQPLPPALSEGNPIFSAVSPMSRRGVRILQSEPTEKGVEFYAYPDTFGGTIFDPLAIHELVISCALSDVAAHYAMSLICAWVAGRPISFDVKGDGLVVVNRHPIDWLFDGFSLPSAA